MPSGSAFGMLDDNALMVLVSVSGSLTSASPSVAVNGSAFPGTTAIGMIYPFESGSSPSLSGMTLRLTMVSPVAGSPGLGSFDTAFAMLTSALVAMVRILKVNYYGALGSPMGMPAALSVIGPFATSSSSLRSIGGTARRVATGGWWGEFFFVI